MATQTPHGSKLKELATNSKLPPSDLAAVQKAIHVYQEWIHAMSALTTSGSTRVGQLVGLLNEYKRYIELELIWDSSEDFLFRQRGQLKLDNSVTEEFLPWLINPSIVSGLDPALVAGPQSAFASSFFSSTIGGPSSKPGLQIRAKDQDFTISRPVYIAASFDKSFSAELTDRQSVSLAYIAAECKTNLDKTMFQEAIATAHDLRIAVPASRYYLLCEYLDMKPISTSGTDIAEVLILRGKRMNSNLRKDFSSASNRTENRATYRAFLQGNPIREAVIMRFVSHIDAFLNQVDPDETDVVSKGFF